MSNIKETKVLLPKGPLDEYGLPLGEKEFITFTYGVPTLTDSMLKAGITIRDLYELSYCLDCVSELTESKKPLITNGEVAKGMKLAMEWINNGYDKLLIRIHDLMFRRCGRKKGPVILKLSFLVAKDKRDDITLELTRNKRKRSGVASFFNATTNDKYVKTLSE